MSENKKFANEKEEEIFRHFRLGEHLLQRNMITLNQLRDAMKLQQDTGKLIGEIFVENGVITKEELEQGLGHQNNANNIVDDLKCEMVSKKIKE